MPENSNSSVFTGRKPADGGINMICSMEDELRGELYSNPDKSGVIARLIDIYLAEGRDDEELLNLYWDLAASSNIEEDKKRRAKCLSFFSDRLKEKEAYSQLLKFLPEDKIGQISAENLYTKKEINKIPNDYNFRYRHHDYKLLKGYKNKLGAAVLHLGCNLGLNSVILARNGFFVHGVDIQKDAIAEAMEIRGKEAPEIAMRITYQAASFTDMILPDNCFDSVIAFDVFEHIYENDLETIFSRISSAVKKGGYLVFHLPLGNSFFDPAHVNIFDVEKAERIFGGKFAIERIFVTDEKDNPNDKRINIIARNQVTESLTENKSVLPYNRIDEFTSNFFNEFYSAEKAKSAIKNLYDSVINKTPYSLIRIGDVEARLLAFNRSGAGNDSTRAEAEIIERNLGINPLTISDNQLKALQEELINAMLEADILGTHHNTVNRGWSDEIEKVYNAYHITSADLCNEIDVVINAEILDQGFLLPLLSAGRILLIGNAAPRFLRLLNDSDYRQSFAAAGMPAERPEIAGSVFIPHKGAEAFQNLPVVWEEIQNYDFDIAIIAASLVGKLFAGRIKRELGRAALDIGWSMQYLADASSPVAPARDANYMAGRRGFNNLFKGRIN